MTAARERLEDREYPVVIITDDPDVPDHINAWLQRRQAERVAEATLTLNHAHARATHISQLATDAAPGSHIAPRRRVNWWSLLAGLAAITFVVLSIVGAVAILQQIAER